jgi:hypothetical protein
MPGHDQALIRTVGMDTQQTSITKRHALALAAALTLALGTAGAALTGLAQTPAPPAAVSAVAPAIPASAPPIHEADD